MSRDVVDDVLAGLECGEQAARAAIMMREVSAARTHARLWAHCVSEHACILSPETSMVDLRAFHAGEHRGPCTIRNHPKHARHYTLRKIATVLAEAEENTDG